MRIIYAGLHYALYIASGNHFPCRICWLYVIGRLVGHSRTLVLHLEIDSLLACAFVVELAMPAAD